MSLIWLVIYSVLSSFFTWTKPINLTTVRWYWWGFCPCSKLSWNAWKCLESYGRLKMNVNHLLAWRQLSNTGHKHPEFPYVGPTLSMAIWKQIEKQTDMDPSSKKTNGSSQTWNPEKPRKTKPSLHSVNNLMFSPFYFFFPFFIPYIALLWYLLEETHRWFLILLRKKAYRRNRGCQNL